MAKYFLGSVGEATAFRMNADGSKTFMFHATSITDQGINITSSQDEIRAGQGAPIVATFNHDASVQLTLTDVFWKSEYVESKLGVNFAANANDYQNETVVASASGLTLRKNPVTALLPCSADAAYLIWYTEQGKDEWQAYSGTVSGNILATGFTNGKTYCVRYLANDEQAREAWITSDILPNELYLIIKTPIYAGDACAASNGNIAGHITFEIPRYKLDPNLDLAFAMSSNVTMSLSGMAMAYTSGCNENGSKLMRIVENINGRVWYTDLTAIYIDPDFNAVAGNVVPVYGVYKNGSVVLLDNTAKYNNANALTFGISTGVLTVTLNAGILGVADTDTIATTATSVSESGLLS